MREKCLAQEQYNRKSLARAQTRTACSGVERTNHEATAPTDFVLKACGFCPLPDGQVKCIGYYRITLWLCVKTSFFVQNHSYENVLCLHVQVQLCNYMYANQTHFRIKGFAQTLTLKQRHMVAQ